MTLVSVLVATALVAVIAGAILRDREQPERNVRGMIAVILFAFLGTGAMIYLLPQAL